MSDDDEAITRDDETLTAFERLGVPTRHTLPVLLRVRRDLCDSAHYALIRESERADADGREQLDLARAAGLIGGGA